MSTIHYEQIICASSQKSITTGSPGFGVRSKSPGISDMEADELFTKCGINYRLPMDNMATEEAIMSNPDVESEYPSLYTFREVTLNSGETRYIVAKTLYLGLDYGYFAQMEGARRAGSNYIAHLLVFKECPSVTVMSNAIGQKTFLPQNTICTPENKELCSFLVGDPTPLNDGVISIEDTSKINNADIEFGWLIIALLQLFKNSKCGLSNGQNKILFKVNHQKVDKLLCSLGSLPNELTEKVFFQANTRLMSSVPDGLNMLIINEKEGTPTDDNYHITVNLLDSNPKTDNIENNYLYDQIINCCQEGDTETLLKIIQLFLGLKFDKEIDYPFVYKLMLLASTSKELTIEQLNIDTLDKIASTSLSSNDERAVWEKVNNAINGVFSVPCQANDVRSALEDVNYIKNKCPHHLSVSPNSCDFVIDLLFNKSERFIGILGSSKERLDSAIYMIENAQKSIPNEQSLYNSLNTSNQQIHWERFIKLYYGQNLRNNIGIIINHILDSNLQNREDLANTFFPIDECFEDWKDLINGNIKVTKAFNGLLAEYFVQQIGKMPNEGIKNFLSINKDSRDLIDNDRIVNTYLNSIEKRPTQIDEGLLLQVRDSLLTQPVTKEKCSLLITILEERHLTYVDTKTITLAQTLTKNKEYLLRIFDVWLNDSPQAKEVATFANNVCDNPKDAARIIESIWNTLPKKKRTDYVLHVTDNMSWRKYSLKRVSEYLSEKELKQVLIEENSFIRKLVRKGTSAIVCMLTNKKH